MPAAGLVVLLFATIAGAQRPAALVFENALYQQRLLRTGVGNLIDLIDCSPLGSCNPPAHDIADRVVAYVAAVPRNISLLRELPNLKLYQSTWYLGPLGPLPGMGYPTQSPDSIPPGVTVAYWVNFSMYNHFAHMMADWVAASMFRWNFRLQEKEAAFRSCAWKSDAPLSCPPLTSTTGQRSLRGMTFGVIGYGTVGSAMAETMANLGMRVVASKHSGPFTPTPPGLAWLSGNNDRVWRESDFVLISVPFAMSVINETSLSLMKPNAVLISVNPMRDNELDALYEVLRSRSIGGAFIDAWNHGCPSLAQRCGPPYGSSAWPTADKRFLALDNVQITGNNMDQDDSFWANSAEGVGYNLKALVTGRDLSGVVRPATSAATSATGNTLQATMALMQEPQTPERADAPSEAWLNFVFQLGLFGFACFMLGAIVGSRWAPRVLSSSRIAIRNIEPTQAEHAMLAA